MPTKTTKSARKEDFQQGGQYTRDWYVVDATGKTLGRLATEISKVLRGKHKPIYTPHVDTGDYVVVVNAGKIHLTGAKWSDKIYYRHTGYPGGLKEITAEKLREKTPTALVEKAVKGMMPKNQLNRDALLKLKVYADEKHPHTAQKPKTLEI
ncbi:MAG: large subunit ribosomal protein L13 [bacterium]|jgi:large subunit ribosomal protein L13